MNKVKYLKRRQFALGPEFFDFEGWVRNEISEELRLTVHPDLPLLTAGKDATVLVLMGYMIDPYAPEKTDREILEGILADFSGLEDLITRIERLSGRFVLIAQSEQGSWLLHDAVGLRQVCYYTDSENRTWCASQPDTLAEMLRLPSDQEVIDFKNLPAFVEKRTEFWLINDRTPYQKVFSLLPNHFLDLRLGNSCRFWPREGCIVPMKCTRKC